MGDSDTIVTHVMLRTSR